MRKITACSTVFALLLALALNSGCSRAGKTTRPQISDCAVPGAQVAIIVNWDAFRKSELGRKWDIDGAASGAATLSLRDELQASIGIQSQDIIASILTADVKGINLASLQAELLNQQKNPSGAPTLQLSNAVFAIKTVLAKPLSSKDLEKTLRDRALESGGTLRTADRENARVFIIDTAAGKGFAAALASDARSVYLAPDEPTLFAVLDGKAAKSAEIANLTAIEAEIPEAAQFRIAFLAEPGAPGQTTPGKQGAASQNQAALARSLLSSFQNMQNAGCGITISSNITLSARFKLGSRDDAVNACNVLQAGVVPVLMLSIMMQGGVVPPDMYDRIVSTQDGPHVNLVARLEESEIMALIKSGTQAAEKQTAK